MNSSFHIPCFDHPAAVGCDLQPTEIMQFSSHVTFSLLAPNISPASFSHNLYTFEVIVEKIYVISGVPKGV